MSQSRRAFTLVEMLVVIAIILALAALAAAFLPRVNESQNLTRAVDSLQQWLLTAKMRAKRDGLNTGLRFTPATSDAPGEVSQFQYVQQPEPLCGSDTAKIVSVANGTVTFAGVDFTLGGSGALVIPGDRIQIYDGNYYPIASVTSTTLQMAQTQIAVPGQPLEVLGQGMVFGQPAGQPISATLVPPPVTVLIPTSDYRIIRMPRVLLGEAPLTLPRNYAAMFHQIPGSTSSLSGTNVMQAPNGFYEVLFSPSGAVVSPTTGSGFVYISVWDSTMDVPDINKVGIVGVRVSNGFIGAYEASPGSDPFHWVKTARESGM